MDYGNSSIDFCYQLPESRKLYFELRNVQQRKLITDSIDHQLLPESCARL
jgi:DNA-binding sugar fermentation-stimulating protein